MQAPPTFPAPPPGPPSSSEAMASSARPAKLHVTSKLASQTKELVLNVFEYFNKGESESVLDVAKKTSEATRVSERAVLQIRAQAKRRTPIRPRSCPQRRAPKRATIGDVDKGALRRAILAIYERGDMPTLSALMETVKEPPLNFKGSRSSLWRLMQHMGFRYKKFYKNCAMLVERSCVVAARSKFVRELRTNRCSESPRPEIYLDETWINQNMKADQDWTHKEGLVGARTRCMKGGTYIIVHAGSSEGFVKGAMYIYKSKMGRKGDYSDTMDSCAFKKWFQEQLLPNIPPRSLIIMDNAPYHNMELYKTPSISSGKGEITKWLTDHSIPHDSSHTKAELFQLVKLHKEDTHRYVTDELAAAAGHKVLRLPQYHSQFNPIELVWVQIKDEVKKNSDNWQYFNKLGELIFQAINHVTPDDWRKYVQQTRELQDEYSKKDQAFEHMYETFSTELTDSDSSSDESDTDS